MLIIFFLGSNRSGKRRLLAKEIVSAIKLFIALDTNKDGLVNINAFSALNIKAPFSAQEITFDEYVFWIYPSTNTQ